MSARNELAWDLLDRDGDPVPGDPERVTAAQRRYAGIARTIHDTADRLRKVAAADGLQGRYADAMQDKAKDVVNDLTKASGRYDAVAKAVGDYQPALADARTESAAAVRDAEDAAAAGTKAGAMPDPSAGRAPDAGPLTEADHAAVKARDDAAASADAALAAAKNRLQRAVDALDEAGRALERAVTANRFKDDHLSDTTLDKFNAALKVIVKVLQWVGVALAAVALIFPGVALFVVIGAVVAATVLVVDVVLAAQGETSWLDVAFAAVGVLLLGAGSALAKGLQNIGNQLRGVLGSAFGRFASPQIEEAFAVEMRAWMAGTSTMTPAEILAARNGALAAANAEGRTAGGLLPEAPEWWQFTHPEYLATIGRQLRDLNIVTMLRNGTFLDLYPKFFAGVDVVAALRAMGGLAGRLPGAGVGAPSAWYYALAGLFKGLGYGMFGLDLASGPVAFVPGDDHKIDGWDDAKDGTTT
jgi:hypothetical protein